MCGIVGQFNASGEPVARDIIGSMTRSLMHRGPDDFGVFCQGPVGLGATRLSIQDLSHSGHMPMIDQNTGNTIIFNGEVYNFRELVQQLDLVDMQSHTDTEVVLKAYSKLGAKCLNYFNGIFAFAIWDNKKNQLFCARDRLGVKPFYFYRNESTFSFASEIKALLAGGLVAKPNMAVIHDYLTQGLYDHGAGTFFAGVEQLAPGHYLVIDNNTINQHRYWDIDPDDEATEFGPSGNLEESSERFLALARDAVRIQLRSDAPIAIHVSGGLDSNLLMALVNDIQGGQGNIRAFTYDYGQEKYDETPYAKMTAEHLGWNIDSRRMDVEKVPELANEAIMQQEQPFPGMVTLCKQNLIKETVGAGAKVILEGQGGDEIGGGYQYYVGPLILDLISQGHPEQAAIEIREFGHCNGVDLSQSLNTAFGGLAAYYKPGRSADGTRSVQIDCLSDEFLSQEGQNENFAQPFNSHFLNMQYRDIFHTKLQRILRSCDRASMAYGRELRVPLLDHRLVELTCSLPASHKIQTGHQRLFMRNAASKLLPEHIMATPKRAVVDPMKDWLKGPLKDWAGDIINSNSFESRGLFNANATKERFDTFVYESETENAFHIWQWLVIELWFQKFIDG